MSWGCSRELEDNELPTWDFSEKVQQVNRQLQCEMILRCGQKGSIILCLALWGNHCIYEQTKIQIETYETYEYFLFPLLFLYVTSSSLVSALEILAALASMNLCPQ